jgi:multicomponent Na+:H+ antiporter subunit B
MLLVLLVATAIFILRVRNLFSAVMLLSIYSFLMAGIFVLLDAVDVAFTEAAVGAGISTILMLGTLALTTSREKVPARISPFPLMAVVITGAALAYATLDMPDFGDANAPAQQHVAPRYIEDSPREIGIPNMVTSVLASYRGYDTLGEVVVIFTAGVGVMMMLKRRRRPNKQSQEGGRDRAA